jgi:hypothetical protein
MNTIHDFSIIVLTDAKEPKPVAGFEGGAELFPIPRKGERLFWKSQCYEVIQVDHNVTLSAPENGPKKYSWQVVLRVRPFPLERAL